MYQSIQGNIGLGKAIEYFTSQGFTVCLPLNDTQKYDLVVDIDNHLQRISVKTSRFKDTNTSYSVLLKNCGGASGKSKTRLFDNNNCDFVFVLTADDKMYLIPAREIPAKHSISIGNKYTEYEVKCKPFSDFATN